MILSDITHALLQELKYLFADFQGTFILDTHVKEDVAYNFPLCILELGDGSESARLPGNGLTRIDLDFSFRVYNFEADAYNEEDENYSTSLMDIIDTIRNYFENETWTTQEMVDLTKNYGFRLTFMGINKAESLQSEDKVIIGYRINFSSVAFDNNTNSTYEMMDSSGTVNGTIVFK